MRTKTAKLISGSAQTLAYGLLVGAALILMSWPASARSDVDPTIHLASQQWRLVDQITQSTMLAALGITSERHVRAIEEARDRFSRDLSGLRDSDAEFNPAEASQPEMMSPIARLEAIWPHYDATLQTIITELRTAPWVDDAHIKELAEIHTQIILAIDDTIDALGQ